MFSIQTRRITLDLVEGFKIYNEFDKYFPEGQFQINHTTIRGGYSMVLKGRRCNTDIRKVLFNIDFYPQ